MQKLRQNILAVTIGFLTALILLEAALRITGAFYMKDRLGHKQYEKQTTQDAYTILCLGNSWTMGAGAEPGESYPDHLRRMLENTFHDKDIRVINAGVDNLNSAEMLDRLKPQLNSIRPDLVILRTGEPNAWNTYKYSQYLKREKKTSGNFYLTMLSLNDFLYEKSRAYRLTQLLIYNVAEKISSDFTNSYHINKLLRIPSFFTKNPETKKKHIEYKLYRELQHEKEYKKALELVETFYKEATRAFVSDPYSIIRGLFSEQDIENAISCFKKAIEYQPNEPDNFMFLGDIYAMQGDQKNAAETYIEGIKSRPDLWSEDNKSNLCYLRLKTLYTNYDMQAQQKIINDLKQANPYAADVFLAIATVLTVSKIAEWLKSDLKEINRIIRSKGIRLIIQNYPPDMTLPERVMVNSVIRKKTREFKIPFVDNELLFLRLYAQGEDQRSYHSASGPHFNAKGYEAMAGFVYDKIIEEGFIK
jgi:lysophospholipase L1-like esterase